MDHAPMCERILHSIENIINNDPELQDFAIVPTDDNTRNKSPVLYQNHHLGLESWCIKYVYQYACSRLMKIHKNITRKSNLLKEDINYLIMGALMINPDVTTFWNMKRHLLEQDILSYEQEFFFSKLLLTRKAKSNEAFSYRRWLLTRILAKMSQNDVVPPVSVLEGELSICTACAVGTPNNYHAWTHRQWCMSKLAHYFPDLIHGELEFSEEWISTHVSENTGYHYRQFLIGRLKTCENLPVLMRYFDKVIKHLNILSDSETVQFLTYLLGKSPKNMPIELLSKYTNYIVLLLYELLLIIESINNVYIEHESLWLHRRFVIHGLIEISHEILGENVQVTPLDIDTIFKNHTGKSNLINFVCCQSSIKESCPRSSQGHMFQCSQMYKILCDSEKSFLHKNLNRSVVQRDLALRHEKWLNYIVGVYIS